MEAAYTAKEATPLQGIISMINALSLSYYSFDACRN